MTYHTSTVASKLLRIAVFLLLLLAVETFRPTSHKHFKQPLTSRRDVIASLFSAFAVVGRRDLASAANPPYNTAADIPEAAIENHEFVYGYVERVIDGDTIRVSKYASE